MTTGCEDRLWWWTACVMHQRGSDLRGLCKRCRGGPVPAEGLAGVPAVPPGDRLMCLLAGSAWLGRGLTQCHAVPHALSHNDNDGCNNKDND
eukprot:scaffold110620_cov20-Tisochrysis_lutea.AAC.2